MTLPIPTGHSRFGASASERWLECHGSVTAQEPFPNEGTKYTREGSAWHTVAELCLRSGQDAIEYVDRSICSDDITEAVSVGVGEVIRIDPRGEIFTEEGADCVQLYLDTIRADMTEFGGELSIEQRFHLHWLHPEFYGTCDAALVGCNDDILRVYDLKTGQGKMVEVSGNPQLAYYALGANEEVAGKATIKAIELCVVQPRKKHRDGPVRRAVVSHMELLDLAQDLVDAATGALSPDPTFKPGEHCFFCKAKGVCLAVKRQVEDTTQSDFDDDAFAPPNPATFDDETLARVVDRLDLVDAFSGGARAEMLRRMNAGVEFPDYKLVPKRATRKWRDEAAAERALSFDYGLDEASIFTRKLMTPAQVEKLLPRPDREDLKANNENENSLVVAYSSGMNLARNSDFREAQLPAAQTDFDD